MTDFLKNSLNVKDVILIGTIIVSITVSYTTSSMRLTKLEDEFDSRSEQAGKALDLLHEIDVKLESHVAEHRGRDQ